MNKRIFKTLILVLLASCASVAMADPSGRVGRIAYTLGDVDFRSTYDDESAHAEVNWPVTAGNVLTTRRNARTEIRIGSTAVRLDSDSEIEVIQLDDDHFDLRLSYGSAYVRIKDAEMAREFSMYTSQGRILLSEPSTIRIDTDRAPDTTVLNVLDGSARMAATESTFAVRAGKRAEIVNGDIRMSAIRPNELRDEFDSWALSRAQRDAQSQSARYVSPETTGYEDLDRYGSWETTPEYGAIWYPSSVPHDWAPYRVGRWAWVDPWGWTWVDSAPWGYAPFHYGRWVRHHERWCWAPGEFVARPVWAPAMVGWVGGSNWSVSFSAGSAPAVGWFPLAPHEVYVPSYRVSQTYLRQVNVTHVRNVTNITIVNGVATAPAHERYRNWHEHNAVSLMPQEQFVARRTVIVQAHPRAREESRRQFESAPVSAVMPAAIAHPEGYGRSRNRDSSTSNRPGYLPVKPEHPERFQQRERERNDAPPTVRLPMTPDRDRDNNQRRPDIRLDNPSAPIPVPNTQQHPRTPVQGTPPDFTRGRETVIERREPQPVQPPAQPPSSPQPTQAPHPEFTRGRETFIEQREERHQPQPVVTPPPAREVPHSAPQPAPQEGNQDRGRRERDTPRQAPEPQERARFEQPRNVQPVQPAPAPQPMPVRPAPHEERPAQENRAPRTHDDGPKPMQQDSQRQEGGNGPGRGNFERERR
jgi:hypothetical protein